MLARLIPDKLIVDHGKPLVGLVELGDLKPWLVDVCGTDDSLDYLELSQVGNDRISQLTEEVGDEASVISAKVAVECRGYSVVRSSNGE